MSNELITGVRIYLDIYGNLYFANKTDLYIVDITNKNSLELIKLNITSFKQQFISNGKIIDVESQHDENENYFPEDDLYMEIPTPKQPLNKTSKIINKEDEEDEEDEEEMRPVKFELYGDGIPVIEYNNICGVESLYDTLIYKDEDDIMMTSKLQNEQQLYRIKVTIGSDDIWLKEVGGDWNCYKIKDDNNELKIIT